MVEGMKNEARSYIAAGGTIVEYGKRLTERQDAEMGTIYLTSSPTPQCRLGCLRICGKCREMRRSEAEGRFGEAEPEGCASIRAFRRVVCG